MTGIGRCYADIAELLERHVADGTVVDAGHFAYGSAPSPVASASWMLAARLVAAARSTGRARVDLSLLVDDLGVPVQDRAAVRRAFRLPDDTARYWQSSV